MVPYFAWNSSYNVNCEPSGPVLCSQPTSWIIPVVRPVVYSKMSLVELVRGAVSSTQQQQNTAAHLQMIIGCLVPDLCTVYTHRHNPIFLP